MTVSALTVYLRSEVDVVRARQAGTALARQIDLPRRARARLDLVIAELATNVVRHADRGVLTLVPRVGARVGVEVECQDRGPGLVAGQAHAGPSRPGLGLGLAVVAEVADRLDIASAPGQGTRVRAEVWA